MNKPWRPVNQALVFLSGQLILCHFSLYAAQPAQRPASAAGGAQRADRAPCSERRRAVDGLKAVVKKASWSTEEPPDGEATNPQHERYVGCAGGDDADSAPKTISSVGPK